MTNQPYFQPKSGIEIITSALRLYRDHFAMLVMVAVVPHLAMAAMGSLMPATSNLTPGLFALVFVITVILNGIALAALTTAICRIAVGDDLGVFQVYWYTLRTRLSGIILVYFLTELMFAATVIFLIVPGLIVGGLFAASIPIVVVERKSPFQAMGRCLGLVRGQVAKSVAAFTFFLLVAWLLPMIFLVLQPVEIGAEGSVVAPLMRLLGAILGAVTLPLGYSARVLLYFTLRTQEGTPPEQLTEEIEVAFNATSSTN